MAADNLSHAYCFVGPESVGKRTVAEYLSGKILNADNKNLANQPDLTIVEQELNEKTGKTKKNIDVDQIRDLRSVLSRSSFLGGYKIAIIDKAEKMNLASANALLKTLEEPKEKTILFLLTKDESLLPRTIQSRCQMIYFHPVEKGLISKYLLDKLAESGETRPDKLAGQVEEMTRLSLGMPGKVCTWLENIEEYEWRKQEMLRFVSLFNKPFFEKLQKVDELFGDHPDVRRGAGKSDHIAARDNLQKVLNIWLVVVRGFLHSNLGLKETKIKLDNKKALNIIEKIQEAKGYLLANIHPRLLVEQVLLELP